MPPEPTNDATAQLLAYASGNEAAGSKLFDEMYDALHAMARKQMKNERQDHTLSPTALVGEAFVRLIDYDRLDEMAKTRFLGLAATAMRRFLVDYARGRGSIKRGGQHDILQLDTDVAIRPGETVGILALEEALVRLEEKSERQARVVELRIFQGLSVEQAARVLDLSARTVKGDWAMALAWLRRELA